MPRQPSIFISHKHVDRKIATELKDFFNLTSRKEILVFQSSDPLAQAPRLGHPLTLELKKSLWNTGVVILVYTTEDQDWSYCMWECGVATKPESPETRIIVLQCATETPKVFEDQVRVDARDKDGILKFVKDYLTDPEFFPGAETGVAPKLSPDGPEIASYAADLYSKLAKVIPKREGARWPAQPFLRLELRSKDVEDLATAGTSLPNFLDSASVCDMDPRAWQIFGIADVNARMTFGALVKHWAEGRTEAPATWIEDLELQVLRAARHEIPRPQWTQLRVADGTERYTAVLTRVQEVPGVEVLQFDINLVPFDVPKVLTGMGDPCLPEYVRAAKSVELSARSLAPYFSPIAASHFNKWSEYVKKLTGDGYQTSGPDMAGPDRLEITRMLVLATKKHILIERFVINPLAKEHSGDWRAFYGELGQRADVEKVWMLCVDEEEARGNSSEVEAACKFFKERNFKTLYCSPKDVEQAIGHSIGSQDVIEIFGECEYVKLLWLPGRSYTADESKNVLPTIFRPASQEDRTLVQSMLGCSSTITSSWLDDLRAAKEEMPQSA